MNPVTRHDILPFIETEFMKEIVPCASLVVLPTTPSRRPWRTRCAAPRVVEVKTRYRRRPKHVNTTSEKE